MKLNPNAFVLPCLFLMACQSENTDKDINEFTDTSEDTDQVIGQSFVLEDELESPNGCEDFVYYDHNWNDSMALQILGQGLAAMAHSAGEVQTIEVDLTDSEMDYEIMVNMGQDLTHRLCGDVFDPELETIIDQSFLPVNGTLTFTVTPVEANEGNIPAVLEVRIQSADFCADTGDGSTHHENCFNVEDYSGSASIGSFHG